MDPYYPVNKLVEMNDTDLTTACRLMLNREHLPLTEKELDFIHMTMNKIGGHITHLRLAMEQPEVKAKLTD